VARTFRNKNTIAVGWSVRDNGISYFGSLPATWDFRPPLYRRSIYRCEDTGPRREHNQKYRARMRHLVRTGRWDEVVPPTRTSGWESW